MLLLSTPFCDGEELNARGSETVRHGFRLSSEDAERNENDREKSRRGADLSVAPCRGNDGEEVERRTRVKEDVEDDGE